MGRNEKDHLPVNHVAVVRIVMDHVAEDEAERAAFVPEENRWARRLRREVDGQLAGLRRQLIAEQSRHKRPPPIPPEFLALDRAGLLSRLELLREQHGVRYAHLELTGLTTDDLRQMIAAMLEPPREDDAGR